MSGLLCLISACKDLSSALPAGAVDPGAYASTQSAVEMAKSARYYFQQRSFATAVTGGLVSDELLSIGYGSIPGIYSEGIREDTRQYDNEVTSDPYLLHQVRRQARLARNYLATYASDTLAALRAEMYLYEGLVNVTLADLYCSGISLSTVDFNGDFTYQPPSTTVEVYSEAIALFDTAIALSGDSVRIQAAARVAKGRALLSLGRYPQADTVVASVPAQFRFDLPLGLGNSTAWSDRWRSLGSVGNLEGTNGLPFRSANDPRVPFTSNGTSSRGQSLFAPGARTTYLIADAVEARLIQAEAALHRPSDATWLTQLNALRTNNTFTLVGSDTVWNAGTGGVGRLRPLRDPALDPLPTGKTAFDVRLDLIFRERGFWLYLTGHRQGDLRRLVREYRRKIEQTYPIGPYPGGDGKYTTWIDIPIQDQLNPLFSGCLDREQDQ